MALDLDTGREYEIHASRERASVALAAKADMAAFLEGGVLQVMRLDGFGKRIVRANAADIRESVLSGDGNYLFAATLESITRIDVRTVQTTA